MQNKSKMGKFYSALLLLLSMAAGASADVQPPVIKAPGQYTGRSFVANWAGNGDEQYLLSVYRLSDNQTNVSEDFSKVNQTDGKIDASNTGLPEGWDVDIAANGSKDVVYYNDRNHILLDANADKVTTPVIVGGNLSSFVINANLVNADGIAQDNSSVFYVKVYDKAGDLVTSGQIEAMYFAMRQDFDLAEAFGYMPANIGKVEIGLEKSDGKSVGDIAINSITYAYDAPEYVLSDVATTAESYLVDNLDPELVYYYYVKAKSGAQVSPMSGIWAVDEFLPTTAQPATELTSTSFVANWEYLPRSAGYVLQPYRYDVAEESGEKEVLGESFSKSHSGTVDDPVTSVPSPDELTDNPGWTGSNLIAADGMLGANSGRFPVNMSYVHSPEMNLSGNGGRYTIRVKAHGTPGDQLSIYHVGYMVDGALNMHKLTFDDNGDVDETWQMDDGDEQTVLSFEESKLKPFLLDEVRVSMAVEKGDTSIVKLDAVDVNDSKTTSYRLDHLKENATYSYTVQGWRTDEYGNRVESQISDPVYVRLADATGIGAAPAAERQPTVRIDGTTLTVALPHDAPIYVFTADGAAQRVLQGKTGENVLSLESGRAYIVKAYGYAFKVAVR